MNELVINQVTRNLNTVSIMRMERTKFRPLNYFQVNEHSRLLSALFKNSSTLSSVREMLFVTLRSIYLSTESLLTVLQWMQPPVNCMSVLPRDQIYLKAVSGAQANGEVGLVPELIYIIEIERFLKVLQYSHKEITLKILFELAMGMNCLIQGKQEYVLYDKFFAYLYHQFNTSSDFVKMSYQQRAFLQKCKQEKQPNRLNESGLRKIGLISESSPESNCSEDFYDSVQNLLLIKGPKISLNYRFIGIRFNLNVDVEHSINAIYMDESNHQKLYLRSYQLFTQTTNIDRKPTTLTKYVTFQSMMSQRDNEKQPTQNQQSDDQAPPLMSKLENRDQSQSHKQEGVAQEAQHANSHSVHQQTQPIEDATFRVEYEASNLNDFDFEGGLELNFSNFNPDTTVLYQVFSVNSECVAGVKISFPLEQSSLPLIEFPCITPQSGTYDCHSFWFRPLKNIKGFQLEKVFIQPQYRFIKNFVLLVADSRTSKESMLQEYRFEFQKDQQMGDVLNLHDQMMPYFNEDWRRVAFPIHFNFEYSRLDIESQRKIEEKLKKICFVINNMFPNVELVENRRSLVFPCVFEVYAQGEGKYQKMRDNYNRYVFLQLEQWSKLFDAKLIDSLLDNILIFIWSVGGAHGLTKLQLRR